MANNNSSQEKFIAQFSERVKDQVLSLNMVNIEADNETLEKMNLYPDPGTNCVWGLLVVCSRGLYFYAHPSEQAMFGMIRQKDDDEPKAEQFFDFQKVENLLIKPQETKWYEIFSGSKFVLNVEFDSAEKHYKCFINSNLKAAELFEKISRIQK